MARGFDAQWAAGFMTTIRNANIESDDTARNMDSVDNTLAQQYNNRALERVIFIESHDADSNGAQRVPEMIWPGNAVSWVL